MKKDTREWRRLPSGKSTRSVAVYVREWRKFARPLVRALDGRLHSFDPGVAVMYDERRFIQLPAAFVALLNKALSK